MASEISASNDCDGGRYLSEASLYFSLYCNQDQPDTGDIGNVTADSVEDCLDQCSQKANGLCATAAFDSNTSQCYFKNENVTEVGAVSREGWTLGVGNASQIQPLEDGCPRSGTQVNTTRGMGFTLYCHQTARGLDACSDEAPNCRAHTSTFEECLEHCSTMDSLCTGVDCDSTISLGYLNCYPKNGTAQEFDSSHGPATSNVAIHTAKALLDDVIAQDSCSGTADSSGFSTSVDGGNITAAGRSYNIKCNANHPGYGIKAVHATSIDECAEQCTLHGESCLAVVFEASMAHGWLNCDLKTNTLVDDDPNFRPHTNYTLASVQTTTSKQSNKVGPWIAGPILGGIVFIAALLVGWWWLRRRRRGKQAAVATETNGSGAK